MDDDEEIRRAIQTMAGPRPAPVGARDRIVGRVAAKRRHRLIGMGAAVAALIGVVVVGAVLESPGRESLPSTRTKLGPSAPLFVHAGPYGFGIEMTVKFPDNRQLLSGIFQADGKTYPVFFYNDKTDDGPQPHPFPLAAGESVIASATLTPDCSRKAQPPDLVVTSRLSNGTTREDTFGGASNSGKFASEFKAWCSLGVQASVSHAHGAAAGDPVQAVRVKLTIVNPGTKPVTVTSAAFDKGRAHWNPASVTVPPRGTRTLVITATHTSCGTQETPWNAGLLKSNGRAIKVNDGTQWC
jgi:hypothetical protein